MLNNTINKPKPRIKKFWIKTITLNISISADHILISIDAISLFTNVWEKLVIESIIKCYDDISKVYEIPLNVLSPTCKISNE